jgi:hypothetical protein
MSDTPQSSDQMRNMEQRILRVMRKVLAKIVREVSPRPGTVSPLSDETIEDIRECFNLISLREKELAEAQNMTPQEPRYADKAPAAQLVKFPRATARKSDRKGKADPAK